jgi:hypothetical protein
LDERPVVPRVEQISFSVSIVGSTGPASKTVVGDRSAPPSPEERDRETQAAVEAEEQAREAAARRRLSTVSELEEYIRWRFSCRGGELLICDPYLLHGTPEVQGRIIRFLDALDRPIRALTLSLDADAKQLVQASPELQVRLLPQGARTLHDRVWIVGGIALLVGGSINVFLPPASGQVGPATTVADLPHGDALQWRSQFETWWGR